MNPFDFNNTDQHITATQSKYMANMLDQQTTEKEPSLSFEKLEPEHGFISGFKQSMMEFYNMITPSQYKIEINDTEGAMAMLGEVSGALVNPLNLIPAVGAEAIAGQVATKVGMNVFNATLEEMGTNMAARIFKNSVSGGVGGAFDAYQRRNSKLDADYQSSILYGAGFGAIGGEVVNKLLNYKVDNLAGFIQDNPNLKNDIDKISEGGIPLNDQIIPLKDIQEQVPSIPKPLDIPEYKAPELTPSEITKGIITPKQSQIKKIADIDLASIGDNLQAVSELKNDAMQRINMAQFDADIKNKSQTKLNAEGRKKAKKNVEIIQRELDDLEFMEAQINATKENKNIVLKSQSELDADAIRFDKLVARENEKLKKTHEAKLLEYKQQQRDFELKAKQEYDLKMKNDEIDKTSKFLYDNIENKNIEGLASHIDAHVNLLTNELDQHINNWEQNILKGLEHGGSEKWLMKALYNESVPDEIKNEALYAADKWRGLGDLIINKYRKAGVPTGKLEAYYTMIMHDGNQIKTAGIDKYFNDINPLLKVKFSNIDELKPFYEDIVNVSPILGEDAPRKIENLSRRFVFKDSDSEIAYNKSYGYNFTPMQALRNNITYHSKRLGILNALGKYPVEVINKFDELAGANKEATQALINKIFPQNIGYFPTGAEYISAANFAHQTFKLIKTVANPLWQSAYLFGDRVDSIIYMAQKTSIFDAIKTSFKATPDFVKNLSYMPKVEKTNFKQALINYKNDILAANLKGHGFLSPEGKLSATTKLLREFEFNMNGSHTADEIIRNCTGTSYAHMLKNLYKKGELFPNIDQKILARSVDENGFINPYKLLSSDDPKELEVGRYIASQYNEAISAVNPLNSTSWSVAGKDNPANLAWVKQASWTFNVTKKIQLPLLKSLVSSEIGGISKLRAGSLLVSFAALQTSFDEGITYLESIIDGDEYKPDYTKLARNFIGYLVLGHTFWGFKLAGATAYYAGKSLYYGGKYLTSDNTQDEYINEQKIIENAKKSSYIVKLILAAWHED